MILLIQRSSRKNAFPYSLMPKRVQSLNKKVEILSEQRKISAFSG